MTASEPPEKTWEIPPSPEQPALPGTLPAAINIILARRGLVDPDSIQRFLNPSLQHLPAPQSMLGLNQAVTILQKALVDKNPVLIYGDYDADGVCATALLANFFREIGLPALCYLPDRLAEGYGLNKEALHRLRQTPELSGQTAPVMITVDCGINSLDEVAAARRLGFRVIITDHHQPGPELPEAEAILNPRQAGCPFPFQELAGVGVAFYLAAGLRAALSAAGHWAGQPGPNLKKYLALVAIGSVADLVPLTGANRVLVKGGLEILNDSPGAGLTALIKSTGQTPGSLSAETIAYQLAPRINAAGRVGSALMALELLRTQSRAEAEKLAAELEEANRQRKELTERIWTEASRAAEHQLAAGVAALVLSARDWPAGIVGLVASRLVNTYWRPAVVLSIDKLGLARGSVRSVGRIDIHAALTDCAGNLEKFGGHRQAAGLTLKEENIPEFTKKFHEAVQARATPSDLTLVVPIDLQAELHELMVEPVWHYLKLMEPYGLGNPEPTFCTDPGGIKLHNPRKIGAGSIRFQVQSNGQVFNGVGFGKSPWLPVAEKQPLQLAYKICRNEFRGAERWEIRVEDIKLPT